VARTPFEPEGADDPHQCHQGGLGPDADRLRQIGLEPDLEQQEDHAHLGEGMEDLGLVHEPEGVWTDDDPDEKLAEDSRLAEAFHPFARQLCGEPDEPKESKRSAMCMGPALVALRTRSP